MEPKTSPVTFATAGSQGFDDRTLRRVHDILQQLANAVSAMKIFPAEHASVRRFADDLTRKFKAFLDVHSRLEIWISEYSFLCGDQTVYSDDIATKSLPFFFFKDGMQRLYFYQGLDLAEIREFLEAVRSEAHKPAGDSDIVSALWERDLPHIQYYAPDDYLENRIVEECGQERSEAAAPEAQEFAQRAIEIKVDTSKFSKGRVELSDDDRMVIEERSANRDLAREEAPRIAAVAGGGTRGPAPETRGPAEPDAAQGPDTTQAGVEDEGPPAEAPYQDERPAAREVPRLTLTAPEVIDVESLVASSRSVSPEEQFLDLVVEVINLETDRDVLAKTLDVLSEYEVEQLHQANFGFVVLLVQKLRELRLHVAGSDVVKSALIDVFLARLSGVQTVDIVKELFQHGQTLDWEPLIELIRLLGPSALPLAADIFESVPTQASREKIVDFLRASGANDPGALARLAADERPHLSRAVLAILGREYGGRGISHMAVFLGFRDKAIKLEAIQALSGSPGELAARILAGFLNDRDEDIRLEAISRLDPHDAGDRVRLLVHEAAGRGFRAKSPREKQAVLSFLGRTRSPDALAFLTRTVTRRSLWPSSRTREMKEAAVRGLEMMATDEAAAILERGARGHKKAVRQACAMALARLGRNAAVMNGGKGP